MLSSTWLLGGAWKRAGLGHVMWGWASRVLGLHQHCHSQQFTSLLFQGLLCSWAVRARGVPVGMRSPGCWEAASSPASGCRRQSRGAVSGKQEAGACLSGLFEPPQSFWVSCRIRTPVRMTPESFLLPPEA